MTPTIREGRSPSGWRTVVLEHETLRVTVLPDKGAEIYALEWLPLGIDLLWKAPWGLPSPTGLASLAAGAQTAWMDAYGGGWQELFPNAGDACRYRGAELTFHGEASVAAWEYTSGNDADGSPEARFAVRLARSPFRIEKRLSLDPQRPRLRMRERVVNEGAERLPCMWGHHPAYGPPFLAEGCRLEVPADGFEADARQVMGHTWLEPGRRSPWPIVGRVGGGPVDLRQIPGPEARIANMGYVVDLRGGWYALTNPHLGLGIGLTWPLHIFPYVWLWQEFQGSRDYPWYGSVYVMGVEPHSSIPGHGLLSAVERGTARWLEPGEQLEMALCAVLFEDRRPVQRIDPDGAVEFESTGGRSAHSGPA